MNTDINKCKIGYWPNSPTLDRPGDRRRFCFYAKERQISFSIADPAEEYDIVYLTYGCNIHDWVNYKKKYPLARLVFEMVDSYLFENAGLSTAGRGIVRFLAGKEKRIYINYKSALRKLIKVADAVVCSTPLQKEAIEKINPNVHVSLDYFSADINAKKTTYTTGKKLKLVWEGQGYTASNIIILNKLLGEIADEIELHVITDLVIKYPIPFFNKKVSGILSGLACNFHLHEWRKTDFAKLIAGADLAIIPISEADNLMRNKPENKLLMFWEIGMPVITSATPAYLRVMNKVNPAMCCATNEEWALALQKFSHMQPEEKKELIAKQNEYLAGHHSKEELLKKWDAIFESIITVS